MMFKPLMENLGEELLMSYLADFPVKTYPPPGGGAGINGARSGMWKEMARIIGEVRPKFVFVENSPILTSRGLGTVLADLSQMGFDAEWGIMGADNAKLPHRRKRIWLLASNTDCKHEKWGGKQKIPQIRGIPRINAYGMDKSEQGLRAILSPGLCRTCNGLPRQMDRLKAIGNAQIPRVAGFAFEVLKNRMENA
jgi:DNA (cytosine-5)-methyltransferase 1